MRLFLHVRTSLSYDNIDNSEFYDDQWIPYATGYIL